MTGMFLLQMWDIRAARSVRTIWGPYICGDALDMCVDNILTGSWVADDALQVSEVNAYHEVVNVV